MMIGEQPGNDEDLQGKPFVGRAGRLLNRLLEEAGVNRKEVYVTNAVKHFKWEPRGKRRIHKKPSAKEIEACRPWLDAEIAEIRPDVIVCLGATAAQAIFGRTFHVTTQRGEICEFAARSICDGDGSPLVNFARARREGAPGAGGRICAGLETYHED